jgi:hypothetical protein
MSRVWGGEVEEDVDLGNDATGLAFSDYKQKRDDPFGESLPEFKPWEAADEV